MAEEEHEVQPSPSPVASLPEPNLLTPPNQGATIKEVLIEACRRNNLDLMNETLEPLTDKEITRLLNDTTTVMGNHLYHEAAARGNCTHPSPLPSLTNL
jgi:hypothetical protein